MKNQFVISVMSKDRPGIIADITGVILVLGGDLADLTQSVLGGYFSMILVAEFASTVTAEEIDKGFATIESETKIETSVELMDIPLAIEKKKLPEKTYIVMAQAINRKGLVKTMGDFFYHRAINVLDLETTRERDKYTMIFEVDLSHIDSIKKLRSDLQKLQEKEQLEIVLQHNDLFRATHEIAGAVDAITA